MTYTTIPGKGVSLRNMSAKVSDDGAFMSLSILDTPFPNLSAADASDLYEILGDVMSYMGHLNDNEE